MSRQLKITRHLRKISNVKDQDQNKQFGRKQKVENFKINPSIISLERSLRNEKTIITKQEQDATKKEHLENNRRALGN